MKRTFTANIDGQVFNIDDDAYNLLNNYLNQLRSTFPGEDGTEIITDIESRIRELLCERTAGGRDVVVIGDISCVIARMGRPQDLGGESMEYENVPPVFEPTPPPINIVEQVPEKKLYRNLQTRVFGGVIGGIATYLGWNANVMRLLVVLIACFTPYVPTFWPLVIIYLLAWMIIPAAETPKQILQMRGEPLTIDRIGRTVMEESAPVYNRSFWSALMSNIGKIIMAGVGVISILGIIGSTVYLVALITGIVAYEGYGSDVIIDEVAEMGPRGATLLPVITLLIWVVFALLSFIALTWTSLCVAFRFRPASRGTMWVGLGLLLVLMCAGTVCSIAWCGL